jgi:hypothetical protein
MTNSELKDWLALMYPFLASTSGQARYVELVREIVDGGMRPELAKLKAVNRLAQEINGRFFKQK